MERLRETVGGRLAAADVVEAARPKRSPLHEFFTWDNSEAAEQWRLHQARMMLCFIVHVETDPATGRESSTRQFVVIERGQEDGRSYESVIEVMADAERRELLIERALADLEQWREKYKAIKTFAVVFDAIEKVEARIKVKRRPKGAGARRQMAVVGA